MVNGGSSVSQPRPSWCTRFPVVVLMSLKHSPSALWSGNPPSIWCSASILKLLLPPVQWWYASIPTWMNDTMLCFWYYYFYAHVLLVINCENNVLKGMATEAQNILWSTHNGFPEGHLDYFDYQRLRTSIRSALTKLDEELACKTTVNAGTLTDSTKMPMGYGLDNKSIFISSWCKYH